MNQLDTLCSKCDFVLNIPYQLICGHRICKNCRSNDTYEVCNICKSNTLHDTICLDIGFANDIAKVKVNCFSCDWHNNYELYSDHIASHKMVICRGCSISMSINTFLEHISTNKICVVSYKNNTTSNRCLKRNADGFSNNDIISKIAKSSDFTAITTDTIVDNKEQHSNDILSLAIEYKKLKLDTVNIRKSIDNNCNIFNSLSALSIKIEKQLAEMTSNINETKYTTYDGINILKIDDFTERILKLTNKADSFIKGSTFYTSTYGYKLETRLHVKTNKTLQSYLYAVVVLKKGDYDDLLTFPFKFNIQISILNQHDSFNSNNIDYLFNICNDNIQFIKPTKEESIQFKTGELCTINKITLPSSQHMKNDTIYIRTSVLFSNYRDKSIITPNIAIPSYYKYFNHSMSLNNSIIIPQYNTGRYVMQQNTISGPVIQLRNADNVDEIDTSTNNNRNVIHKVIPEKISEL